MLNESPCANILTPVTNPQRQMYTLYVVATPIGNLEDITLRALGVLSTVELIAAEDTRTTRKLLSAHLIKAPRLLSYNDHNMKTRIPAIIDALDEGDVALVSEAGTPAISDPGVELVAAAYDAGHRVEPVPGVSALAAALSASGLSTRRLRFVGFLPRRGRERRSLLQDAAGSPDTLVIYEAPHRLRATLEELIAALGERRVAVCRELTKVHEELFRGTTAEALRHFDAPRGEFTLVIEGASSNVAKEGIDVDKELARLLSEGGRAREAVSEVSELSGVRRREVYRRWIALRQ
jgi:16S rRNA (cytidine1402-2'-O)-methyltransferase